MASKVPKQGPGCKKRLKKSALAMQIRADLKRLGMTQKELAVASGMSESRISRLLSDGSIVIKEQDINQLAIGLKMSIEERDKLRYIAWPELQYIDKALSRGEDVVSLNCHLYDAGLNLLGFDYED